MQVAVVGFPEQESQSVDLLVLDDDWSPADEALTPDGASHPRPMIVTYVGSCLVRSIVSLDVCSFAAPHHSIAVLHGWSESNIL